MYTSHLPSFLCILYHVVYSCNYNLIFLCLLCYQRTNSRYFFPSAEANATISEKSRSLEAVGAEGAPCTARYRAGRTRQIRGSMLVQNPSQIAYRTVRYRFFVSFFAYTGEVSRSNGKLEMGMRDILQPRPISLSRFLDRLARVRPPFYNPPSLGCFACGVSEAFVSRKMYRTYKRRLEESNL